MFIYRLESSYKFYSYDFRWYVSSLKVMALRFHIFILLLFHFFIPFTEKKKIIKLMACIYCFFLLFSHPLFILLHFGVLSKLVEVTAFQLSYFKS